MPKNTFKLSEHTDQEITLEWKGLWKNMKVSLAGELLGEIPTQKALKAGQSFPLPDGTTLEVKLKTGMQTELQVTRDGKPLPGSGGDPAVKLKLAQGIVYFIGGLTTALGVLAEVASIQFLKNLGLGWYSAAFGVLFLVLAFFVGKRSRVALGIALALFIIDGVWTLIDATSAGGRVPTGMVVFRVLLVIPMFGGFSAIKALNASDTTKAKVAAF